MSAYTLQDFIGEMVRTDNLGPRLRDESLEGFPGLVWRDSLYVELMEDGQYCLTLMNDSWIGPELEPAAAKLFDFAIREGYLQELEKERYELTRRQRAIAIAALEYFQRDIDDGEILTAGQEPVDAAEIIQLLEVLQ